jgi:hypothetical protein
MMRRVQKKFEEEGPNKKAADDLEFAAVLEFLIF